MPIPSGYIANTGGFYSRTDGAGPFAFDGTTMVFQGFGVVNSYSSGNQANATANATVPAVTAKTGYITGFEVTGAGATAGGVVSFTITGLLGGVATYTVAVPAGATTSIGLLSAEFPIPLPASAVNTAIVASLPALGAGSTNAAVVLHGFVI